MSSTILASLELSSISLAAPSGVSPPFLQSFVDEKGVPLHVLVVGELLGSATYMQDVLNGTRCRRQQAAPSSNTRLQNCCTLKLKCIEAFYATRFHVEILIHFIPAFFIDPARYPGMSAIDGVFNVSQRFGMAGGQFTLRQTIRAPTSNRPSLTQINITVSILAAARSWPRFRLGSSRWNKNVTLNAVPHTGADFDRTIGSLRVAGNSLSTYFARAFKNGTYPLIDQDQIFMWGRPHPRAACARETVPRPQNWELHFNTHQFQTDDAFWVIVLCIAPATVYLYTGDSNPKTLEVEAGLTKLSRSLEVRQRDAGRDTATGSGRCRVQRRRILL
ncbi:hypothetical protein C8R47DRAFT_1271378 [Mycena vitilis]|nr:hypothetical protein C8R47DRAFT_1271378 [Mycena vitilis]